ncbi:DAK2 domain-containing protein [Georgenia sp. 311]|uniref:DAK2 domain-containing protein n=1 Tax=Georgenia sp. 311 TaxID=2585134 RepID=UPI00159B8468|nr:DAK2 domain-containing protein [Georgenia sp. 311]
MTETLTVLGPAHVRRWFEQGLRSLLAVRRQVDVLNVFPVPDGDTGTNLVLTLAGAARAASTLGADAGLPELTAAAARGALVGARGNSGVILSQAMRGLAGAVAGHDVLDGPLLAAALRAAADEARRAVARPVEGTVLTVADAAAEAALGASDGTVAEVATSAARAAAVALADTRGQLDVLTESDVVDAGAAGYVILLDALAAVADDDAPDTPRARQALARLWSTPRPVPVGPVCGLGAGVVARGGQAAFEVMYVLHATAPEAAALRERLGSVGESLAVVGGSDGHERGLWQVHVHTDDPAAVLADPAVTEQVCVRSLTAPPTGVVACTRLPGLLAPLAATGAVLVLHPDAAGLERAIVDAGTPDVLLLPCDETSAALAREVGSLLPDAQRVVVAGTREELAVLTVVADQRPGAGAQERLAVAAEAVSRLRTRSCGLAEAGEVARELLHRDDELLTAVVGLDAAPGTPARAALEATLRSVVAETAPQADVLLLDGGRPAPDVLLGAQ